MAFSELEKKRLETLAAAFVERHRPPPRLRAEMDFGFRLSGRSIELFEIRLRWQGAPGETTETPVAKATYVIAQKHWKVYWQRADLKWHSYPGAPTVSSAEKFFAIVSEDKHACFFG